MSGAAGAPWRSTFQPDRAPAELDALRQAYLAQRAQLAVEAVRTCTALLAQRKLPAPPGRLVEILGQDTPGRLLVLDDPVFAIWLRFFLRAFATGRSDELALHVAKLGDALADVERRLTGKAEAYAGGTAIAVERARLHPYVRAATPPTYDFDAAPAEDAGYPLALEADLIGHALDNIGTAWPELRDQVVEVIRILGYLPDATFRSCSAARYSGVVYLGTMDESLLDLEESIVHEAGHQVLYRVGELVPLTKPDTPVEAKYVLPWSGSRRDLFGYLHAYYIYALLTKYYWRRASVGDRYAMDCKQRAAFILVGSLAATPVLREDPNLSDQGRIIVEELAPELERLKSEIQSEASSKGDSRGGKAVRPN